MTIRYYESYGHEIRIKNCCLPLSARRFQVADSPGAIATPQDPQSVQRKSGISSLCAIIIIYNVVPFEYMYINKYIHIHTNIHTYLYINIHIHTNIYTYLYIFLHIYTYLYISIHIYTYLYISTHIYTY